MSSLHLERTSVLGKAADSSVSAGGDFAIAQAGPAVRFSLRIDPDIASRLEAAAGFALTQPINRLVGDSKMSMRLGPDEWLLVALEQEAEAITLELKEALGSHLHSLVDITHCNIALTLTGSRAVDVLNTGCPLDLHPSMFPPGMSTRTVFAKCEIILARMPDDTAFRLECWRSFGRYLEGFLRNSARLQGIGN